MDEALKVFGMIFVTHHQPPEVEEPGKEPLHLPASAVTPQWPAILRGHAPVDFVGRNQFNAVVGAEFFIQPVAIVSLVADQAVGGFRHEAFYQGGFDQLYFRWRSAFCPQGERKTMTVGNTHDFRALAALGFAHQSPPFLAGTNVPSTKHSFKSRPPAALRCAAKANRIVSITPERTQSWKRRWAVWYAPYRGGKSCHGAPVRKIHNAPFKTLRRSLHGRPRPSARTLSGGNSGSTTAHCSLVKSIHNYLNHCFSRFQNYL